MSTRMLQTQRRRAGGAMAQLLPHLIRGAHLEFFAAQRITQTQFMVMVAIHASRTCAMGQLAKGLHVSMPTMTGVISRLARAGLVRRYPRQDDRRGVLVELTGKGQVFIRRFQAVVRARWEEVLQVLSANELEAFHRAIAKVTTRLQQPR